MSSQNSNNSESEYDYYYAHPSQTVSTNSSQDHDILGKDKEESMLLKSFNDRSLGLAEATKFFQKTNFLSFSEEVAYDRCCSFSKSQPFYIGSNKSKEAQLKIIPTKSYFRTMTEYIVADNTGIIFSQLIIRQLSKANMKILAKSPNGSRIGSIEFEYEGYTSMDSFQIMDSGGDMIMTMKPHHISLQNFEFPVMDQSNNCVANIFHKGGNTIMEISPNLSPKLKLLIIPLVILLMIIKAKLRKKQNK